MRNRLAEHPTGLQLSLMLVLTFSTGMIDAVGYLGLDRVFTGNMTGNVVILGMALTGAADLPIAGPVIALVGFMLGAAISGRVLRSKEAGWSGRTTTLLTVVALVILGGAVAALVTAESRPEPVALSITAALGLAMGTQAGAARHIAVKDVTTVVVTSTMVGLAFDSWFGSRSGQQWARRLGAILLIGLGATAGALLLMVDLWAGMAVSAGLTLLVALIGHLGRPRAAAAPAAPAAGRAAARTAELSEEQPSTPR